MHCPYSRVEPLQLGAGEYLVVVEGYSRYQGEYLLEMQCGAGCA
jgi:hypothetical protein